MRSVFDKLNDSYAKYCSPSEHLAVGEIIVLFKDRVFFKHYIHSALVLCTSCVPEKVGIRHKGVNKK
jgi:hypothetical protein